MRKCDTCVGHEARINKLLLKKLIYTGFMPNTCVALPHVPFDHHYMHRYDLSFGQLGCLAPVLTPTFPIVRLGGKGSTAALPIVEDIGLPSGREGGLGHGEDTVLKG